MSFRTCFGISIFSTRQTRKTRETRKTRKTRQTRETRLVLDLAYNLCKINYEAESRPFSGVIAFILVLILPPPPGMSITAKNTGAVALLMAIWWISEAIPISATSLLPLLLFPVLGVLSAKDVSVRYADRNIFLFMGGFFIAMAMQRWELHKRIALYIIRFLGTSPHRIVLGFMVASCFLSMWISNTATTMMMFPIGLAVVLHAEAMIRKEKLPIDIAKGKFNFGTTLMLG
ncbi:hypothetical protein BXT86_01995, partial [candidate division WOR-3 bacterium 4484_100]